MLLKESSAERTRWVWLCFDSLSTCLTRKWKRTPNTRLRILEISWTRPALLHWAIFLIHKDMLQPQPAATSYALLGYSCSETKLQSQSSQQTAPPLHHLPYMQNESPRENRSILSCHHKRILCNFCRDPSSGNTKHKSAHAFANSISMLWTTNDNSRSTFSKTQPTPSYSPWCLPDIGPLLPKPVRVDAMGGGCDVKWTWGTIKYLYCFTSGTPQPPKSTINWSNSMHGG